jgi:hypothetical protein
MQGSWLSHSSGLNGIRQDIAKAIEQSTFSSDRRNLSESRSDYESAATRLIFPVQLRSAGTIVPYYASLHKIIIAA